MINGRLERWGRWLKQQRPRVGNERVDADLITRYIESCSGEGHYVRDAEHGARVRGLPGTSGPMEDEPTAVDEGPKLWLFLKAQPLKRSTLS
jgi:hypothetical protein